VAQGITFGFGRTATFIALDSGQGKLGCQQTGGLQGGYQGALWFGRHADNPY
jgi:hypothetical protein